MQDLQRSKETEVASYAYREQDTIAAISTAASASGIGIVRISGPMAVAVADRVFCSPNKTFQLKQAASHTIHYGFVADGEEVLDEVLVAVLRAPRTFTAEDTVEINCHGGMLVLRRVLESVIKNGARTAEPGEFTRRAYLNGRIDLSRAEAVMDVISARSELALHHSIRQARGSLARTITALREEILAELAHIEASLDDPENLDYTPKVQELQEKTSNWRLKIGRLVRTAKSGRMLREGVRTVLAGKPNAGKSSLMNLLLGQDRAIVTQVPGTTRDVLTEFIDLEGIPLLITDTAGIRGSEDEVERIGIARAREHIQDAELVLWLVDGANKLDENDAAICRLLPGHRTIVLLNKADLPGVTKEKDVKALLEETGMEEGKSIPILSFSARTGEGQEKLVELIRQMLFAGDFPSREEEVITNERHKELLVRADAALVRVQESLAAGMSEDFFSVDLMDAYGALGEIIGQEVGEDLVNEIFSRFCMGK